MYISDNFNIGTLDDFLDDLSKGSFDGKYDGNAYGSNDVLSCTL